MSTGVGELRAQLEEEERRFLGLEQLCERVLAALGADHYWLFAAQRAGGAVELVLSLEPGSPALGARARWLFEQQPEAARPCFELESPALRDRNRVVSRAALRRRMDLQRRTIYSEVIAHSAFRDHDFLRVLLCEERLVLGVLFVFFQEPAGNVQKQRLASLAGTLRDRVRAVRTVGGWIRDARPLASCLDAVSAPAFLLDAKGQVRHTNAAGQARLERGLGWRGAGSVAFELQVSSLGLCQVQLLLEAGAEARVTPQLPGASLSPRLREVLELVLAGHGNKHIAEALGVSLNTVEYHVSRLFDRYAVRSRAALVAAVLRGEK